MHLKMIRYSAPVRERAFPEGYTWCTYDGSESAALTWVKICNNGLFDPPEEGTEAFNREIRDFEGANAEEDCLFAVDPSGNLISTITVIKRLDGTGLVHMVGSLPETRGKGLGHALLAVGLARLEKMGVPFTRLNTDDFRLAALKTYLDAGFRPVIPADTGEELIAGWKKVLADLNYGEIEFVFE